jgi:hypothetical protein
MPQVKSPVKRKIKRPKHKSSDKVYRERPAAVLIDASGELHATNVKVSMRIKRKANGWQKKLKSGDEVYWEDPDVGTCSRHIRIQKIKIKGDMAQITGRNGDYLECFLKELK